MSCNSVSRYSFFFDNTILGGKRQEELKGRKISNFLNIPLVPVSQAE